MPHRKDIDSNAKRSDIKSNIDWAGYEGDMYKASKKFTKGYSFGKAITFGKHGGARNMKYDYKDLNPTVAKSTFYNRLRRGWSIEDAMEIPVVGNHREVSKYIRGRISKV